MEFYQTRKAQIRLYHLLKELGYAFFGYKPDRSRPMEDYYDRESWDGVATHPDHPGVVVCVGVGKYDVQSHSGKTEVKNIFTPGETCQKCQGSGVWPGGLTYAEALQNPRGQHTIEYLKESHGGQLGHPDIVSPLVYFDDGRPKCGYCTGRGHKQKCEQVNGITWPVFQANPRGRNWHVEINGKIIISGIGLGKAAEYSSGPDSVAEKAARHIVEKIHAAVTGSGSNATAVAVGDGTAGNVDFQVKHDRDWTWVHFTGKPDEPVREALKQQGGRFSKKRMAWYIPRRVELAELQQRLGVGHA